MDEELVMYPLDKVVVAVVIVVVEFLDFFGEASSSFSSFLFVVEGETNME